jgi:transglutaminase-like putative cysteine protease
VAIVVLISAIAESALHLIPLQSKITPQTLEFARGHLIPPEWKNDFETLAALPIWREQPLRTLFGHLELAHYTTYQLENWKVDEETYHHYVLSPAITGDDRELNWRRSLWDNFYPRVRHESSLQNAASIVGQFLRQRVTIASDYPGAPGIESAWNVRVANPSDFECLYVAALRSVGIPARLNASRHTEYWTGQTWESAPRPDDLQ